MSKFPLDKNLPDIFGVRVENTFESNDTWDLYWYGLPYQLVYFGMTTDPYWVHGSWTPLLLTVISSVEFLK